MNDSNSCIFIKGMILLTKYSHNVYKKIIMEYRLLKLKHEKKQLQRLLNKIKHKFEDENGRSMATREDRAPHEEMFQRYKLLKIQISDMEKTETQLPLPQHDLSQTL
eukprot:m.45551 g.45551  ORF g.45551 m.45551 type:complete len:107 (-) comp10263_c0_seq1:21-341(-)